MDLERLFRKVIDSGNAPKSMSQGIEYGESERRGIELIAPADHDYVEICIGLEGESFLAGVNSYIPLSEDESCIVFPGSPHSESVRQGQSRYGNMWIVFRDPINIHSTLYTRVPDRFKSTVDAILEPIPGITGTLDQLAIAYESGSNELTIRGLWTLLLGQILGCRPSEQNSGTSHIARLVRFTALRMHESPETQWTVGMLGNLVGWSENHYSFRFREVMKTSPMKFLLNIRLERSRELLTTTPMRISETAYAVGFNSLNYFAKRFREAYGMVPREYREKYGK